MSWNDYEKAKSSAASGGSGSKSIAEKRVEAEIKKSNPSFTGFADVLQNRIQDVDSVYIDNYFNDLNSYRRNRRIMHMLIRSRICEIEAERFLDIWITTLERWIVNSIIW